MKNLKLSTCLRIFRKYDVDLYNYIKYYADRRLNMDEISSYARLLRDSHKRA